MNFLLVMHDRDGGSRLRRRIEGAGHILDWTAEGRRAVECASSSRYDAVIVDLGVPDMPGVELCAELRQISEALPILALSADGRLADRLESFSAGVDDVLVKPFDVDELMARLTAIQRRKMPAGAYTAARPTRLIVLDRKSDVVPRSSHVRGLSDRERRVFDVMLRHKTGGVPVAAALHKTYGLDLGVLDKSTAAPGKRLALYASLAFLWDISRKLVVFGARLGRTA